MKKICKYICVLLVVSICFTTTVYAAEDTNIRTSKFFISSSVWLTKTSSTQFQAWFDVDGFGVMEEIGASVIKIQKSTDGVNWTTMITYRKETSSNLIASNTGTHISCVSYIGTPGCYYRAVVTLYAKNSSGIGEVTEYTSMLLL